MFHIALFEPEIAGNVGSIARTCLATGCELHLIRPLGFRLSDEALKRSGMDYWHEVQSSVHDSYTAFQTAFAREFANKRVFALSTKATLHYQDVQFEKHDVLLFGPESRGLPLEVRSQCNQVRIPMTSQARSLNLAVSAGIVVYAAWQQQAFAGSSQSDVHEKQQTSCKTPDCSKYS